MGSVDMVVFMINGKDVVTKKKPTANERVVQLQTMYNRIAAKEFPIVEGALTITRMFACANNQGCSAKKKDYLVGMKNAMSNVRPMPKMKETVKSVWRLENVPANASEVMMPPRQRKGAQPKKIKFKLKTPYPAVMIILEGFVTMGRVKENVSIRVSQTGRIKVSLGMSKQSNITTASLDDELMGLLRNISNDLFATITPDVVNENKIRVENISASYNIVTRTSRKPDQKLKDHKRIAVQLSRSFPNHKFENKNAEHHSLGAAVIKGSPTVLLHSWGSVQIMGAKTLALVRDTMSRLNSAFNSVPRVERENAAKPNSRKGGGKVGQYNHHTNPNRIASVPLTKLLKKNLQTLALRKYSINPAGLLKKNLINAIKKKL